MAVSTTAEKAGDTASGIHVADERPAEVNPDDTQHDETHYLSGIKLFLTMMGITVMVLLIMLDTSILGTAIPQITSDFEKLQDVGWYIGAYLITSATIQPLTGKIYTYFSTKWSFLVFFLTFELGSVICGAAQSSLMLILGRAIAGSGASGVVNGALTIVQGACPLKTRALYSSMILGLGQIGVILGPLLGGVFTQHATWRWCFFVNLPLGGAAALFVALIAIPDQIPKEPVSWPFLKSVLPRFDLVGFALFAPASVMLLLALQFGAGEYGWDSSEVIGLFVGAGITALVFLAWEWKMGDEAMLPLSMIGQRVVWTSALNFSLLVLTAVVGSNFMPIYLQAVKGLSPTMSGVYMLAQILPGIMFILISGALVSKTGYYIIWSMFASCAATIGCGLISMWQPSSGLGPIIGYQILLGARGAGIQMGVVAITAQLPAKRIAIGSSFLVFTQTFMGAIFIAVANTIFQEVLKSEIRTKLKTIDPQQAIAAGGSASAVRMLAPPGPVRDGLFQAITDAHRAVFYLLVGTSIVSFLAALGMGWIDIRVKPTPEKEDKAGGQAETGEASPRGHSRSQEATAPQPS